MTKRPSLAELRRRYLTNGEEPSARTLADLALDPRAGVQAIHRTVRNRKSGQRTETNRIQTLLNFERILWTAGIEHVAGVDEAGLGPLAGPAVAAAVILPHDIDLPLVDDSKRLDAETRERLAAAIHERAVATSVVEVGVEEIERLNIYHAGLEAMRRAVRALAVAPQHVLVDARTIPGLDAIPQNAFEKGDALNYSIACASIIAKVHRDRRMVELDREYPGYGLAEHKGYGTPQHLDAIRRLGASPIHRTSYDAIRQILGAASASFYDLKGALEAAASRIELAAVSQRLRAAADLSDDEAKKLSALLGRRRRRLPEGT